MYARVMYLSALTLYTVLTAVLLVHFDANILVTIFFLSILPVLLFWRLEHLNTGIIPIVLLLTLGVTVAFQATAYINGLWYELAPSDILVFGLFPIEAFVAAFTHILYFIVVYEYFFDDQKSTRKNMRHLQYLIGGVAVLLSFGLSYIYLFSGVLLSNAFALLILGAFIAFLFGVIFSRSVSLAIIGKTALFACAIAPISLVYEYVSLGNDIRFFANTNEYLYVFNVFGQVVPLEEFVFMFLIPFWIAVIYELYVDDAK